MLSRKPGRLLSKLKPIEDQARTPSRMETVERAGKRVRLDPFQEEALAVVSQTATNRSQKLTFLSGPSAFMNGARYIQNGCTRPNFWGAPNNRFESAAVPSRS